MLEVFFYQAPAFWGPLCVKKTLESENQEKGKKYIET
jgi:hypothetical protein